MSEIQNLIDAATDFIDAIDDRAQATLGHTRFTFNVEVSFGSTEEDRKLAQRVGGDIQEALLYATQTLQRKRAESSAPSTIQAIKTSVGIT